VRRRLNDREIRTSEPSPAMLRTPISPPRISDRFLLMASPAGPAKCATFSFNLLKDLNIRLSPVSRDPHAGCRAPK